MLTNLELDVNLKPICVFGIKFRMENILNRHQQHTVVSFKHFHSNFTVVIILPCRQYCHFYKTLFLLLFFSFFASGILFPSFFILFNFNLLLLLFAISKLSILSMPCKTYFLHTCTAHKSKTHHKAQAF